MRESAAGVALDARAGRIFSRIVGETSDTAAPNATTAMPAAVNFQRFGPVTDRAGTTVSRTGAEAIAKDPVGGESTASASFIEGRRSSFALRRHFPMSAAT